MVLYFILEKRIIDMNLCLDNGNMILFWNDLLNVFDIIGNEFLINFWEWFLNKIKDIIKSNIF